MSVEQYEQGQIHQVLVNDEGQYSLWPGKKVAPTGWTATGMKGTKTECSAYVDRVWTDMRPRGMQERSQRE